MLAITASHGSWISRGQESDLVQTWLAGLSRPVVDAVVISVTRSTTSESYTSLHFPKDRSLLNKDLILKSVITEMDSEDTSRVGEIVLPLSLDQALGKKG